MRKVSFKMTDWNNLRIDMHLMMKYEQYRDKIKSNDEVQRLELL